MIRQKLRLWSLLALCVSLAGCSFLFPQPKRVAILDFESHFGDPRYDYIGPFAAESMTTVMNGHPDVILLLDRQDINRYLDEIDRSGETDSTNTRFQRLGRRIKANYLIVGSASKVGRQFVLQCRLFSVKTGMDVPGSAASAKCESEEEILDIIRMLGNRMAYQVSARSPKR